MQAEGHGGGQRRSINLIWHQNQFWSTRPKWPRCDKAWESPLDLPSPSDSSPKPSGSPSRPAWVPHLRGSGVVKTWNFPYCSKALPHLGKEEEPKMCVYSAPTIDGPQETPPSRMWSKLRESWDFLTKNQPANAGDVGSIAGPGRPCMPQATKPGEPQLLSQHLRPRAPP